MQSERIIGVRSLGKRKTYDIQVDNDKHVFYANGVATSNSHSISYAMISYWSAYLKYHYPQNFYLNWLKLADEKIDPDREMKELIDSAKVDKIQVLPPNLELMNENFIQYNGGIYFGFCNVKNVGRAEFAKLRDLEIPPNYTKLLISLLSINKRIVDNLIDVGVFTKYDTRTKMAHDIECLRELTEKELEWLKTNLNEDLSLQDNLSLLARPKKEGGGAANYKRSDGVNQIVLRMNNPGRSLKDNPIIFAQKEENLLGCSLSCSELDGCVDAGFADTTCAEFTAGKNGKMTLAVIIKRHNEYKCKTGENMCFMSAEDTSGEIENIVIFPTVYSEYSSIIYDNSTLLISGERGKENSFVVEKIYQI